MNAPRQAAYVGTRHHSAFFHRVVKQCESRGRPVSAALLKSHGFENQGNAVTDNGGGSKRQVHHAERYP